MSADWGLQIADWEGDPQSGNLQVNLKSATCNREWER